MCTVSYEWIAGINAAFNMASKYVCTLCGVHETPWFKKK